MNQFKAFWQRLNGRERLAVGFCLAVLALVFVWAALIQRPLDVLRKAPALHAQADAQLASMRAMAGTAQALRQTSATGSVDALKALESALASHLGATGSMTALGASVAVSIKGGNAHKLLAFLAAARNDAKALPVAVSLQARQVDGAVLWDGSISLTLGATQ